MTFSVIAGDLEEQSWGLAVASKFPAVGTAFLHAFNEFIGNENFEERAGQAGEWIDKPVLKYLRRKFGKQISNTKDTMGTKVFTCPFLVL